MSDATGASQALLETYFGAYPGEAARTLQAVPAADARDMLAATRAGAAAAVLARLDPDQAVAVTATMGDEQFRRLWQAMDAGTAAALLARLDPDSRRARIATLPAPLAGELEDLMSYPADSAGSLMDSEVTLFHADETAGDALTRIRNLPGRRILDLCVVDDDGELTAVATLQQVAVAQTDTPLAQLATAPPVCVQAMSSRTEVVELLEAYKLASLPVVDFDRRLRGIIRHDALVDAAQREVSNNLQTMVGAGREERALSRLSLVVRKRLPWLQINLGTAFLASAVVALFEDTIARFTALAVLLPVVAGQSGNTGAQAMAVAMRGLALREFRPRGWFPVVRKEITAGFINGVAIAVVACAVVYLWYGTIDLPLILGPAMIFSMTMAGLTGALIPIILTALGRDPAQSASIVLTTVTDVMGFMSFLGLAFLLTTVFGRIPS
ncbi:MAG: magnesium transporter [Spirochaetaceae bacterium]|nr:magnesium transporter [Spirochaetaceae bacterium]